jgi:hypothetical protein
MPGWQRFAAQASHVVLYALMFALPLVGWGMLSAARYPIVLYGPLQLPPILPHDAALYAVLRRMHAVLAFLLFATFLAHFVAALMHSLIFRDGVFQSMASRKVFRNVQLSERLSSGSALRGPCYFLLRFERRRLRLPERAGSRLVVAVAIELQHMLGLEAGTATFGHIFADVSEVEAEMQPAGGVVGLGKHSLGVGPVYCGEGAFGDRFRLLRHWTFRRTCHCCGSCGTWSG